VVGRCSKCKESKGERKITKILNINNIKYSSQISFDGCVYKRPLKFDFYLPEYNLCIEYNRRHHYIPIDFFGGVDGLHKTKKRDNIKIQYCENNNIDLLIIKCGENIKDKLKSHIPTIP